MSPCEDLDVESLDMLLELTTMLARRGIELRLAGLHRRVSRLVARTPLAEATAMFATIDLAAGSAIRQPR